MCSRINLKVSSAELAKALQLLTAPQWSPRYNIGPMQKTLVLRLDANGQHQASSMQWGLVPSWAQDPKIGALMFNARGETVATKPSFRSAFRHRPCLVLATGFYEWQASKEAPNVKLPWHIFRSDGQLLGMAGLWEQWKSADGQVLESCTVITTEPNSFMASIHDRMPVLLETSIWDLWLSQDLAPSARQQLLIPCPDDWLVRNRVSTIVNNVRNESPDCIRPLEESSEPAAERGTLF